MSMFLGQVTINVKAGKSGDGMVAFRKERYVPDGGPAGGDGGRDGDVVLVVEGGLRTLMNFRFNRHFKATPGESDMNRGIHGRGSEDLLAKVSPGTAVRDTETGALVGDLIENGQTLVVAKGRHGGHRNIRFASPRNPAPEIAENSEPGRERKAELELKVLANVSLVGFPSAGKSTLLSAISSVRPKIGTYHFTALILNLGMVTTSDDRSFVAADLPGLIEGASQGVGSGTQFLRHIKRTCVTLHVIDMSGMEGRDPYENYLAVSKELTSHSLRLMERPQVIVANKIDMPEAEENLAKFKEQLAKERTDEYANELPIFPTSGVTRRGIEPLLDATADLLEITPEFPLYEDEVVEEETVRYGFQPEGSEFTINRESDASWVLSGEKLGKLFEMTNFDYGEAVMRFVRQLRSMGVDEALRACGAKDGDIVRISNLKFEFIE